MQLTVKFTDVYDGEEHPRTETIDVPTPTGDLDDWADDHLRPLTGDGKGTGDAGYFAEIVASPADPSLVGREFEWGV